MKILSAPAFSNKSANPYNWLLSTHLQEQGVEVFEYSHARLLRGGYDIVHYHWPDGYINHPSFLKTVWRMGVLKIAVMLCMLRGAKIIWTVHNLAPHDPHYPWLSHFFLSFFACWCGGLIFLSHHSRDEFFKLYSYARKNALTAVIPHGHYRTIYPPLVEKDAARQKLGLDTDAPVLLFFGQIKPYKNMEALLAAFSNFNANARLVIAGKASSPELKNMIENAAAKDPRVMTRLEFIPDADIPLYMAAADLMVLPYRAILNSGAVMLALSYNVPVLVPALGSMKELQQEAGSDWIFLYEGELTAADLERSLKSPAAAFDMVPYEWRDIARKTLDLYTKAINNR